MLDGLDGVEVVPGVFKHRRRQQQVEHCRRIGLGARGDAFVRDRGRHRNRLVPVVARPARDVRGERERDRGHGPHDVADVIRRAAAQLVRRQGRPPTKSRVDLGAQAAGFHTQHLLHGPRHPLVVRAPLRHADLGNVGVHRLGQRLVRVHRVGGAEYPRADLGVGHQCRAGGDLLPDVPEVLDPLVGDLAEEVPDRRGGRDDIGLVAPVSDDVV